MLIFAFRAFWLIWGVLTFAKICEIPEKKYRKGRVRGGRYFLIFQPNDMLNLSLNMLTNVMLHRKECNCIPQKQTNHSWICLILKKLTAETLPNKLSLLPKKTINTSLCKKTIWLKFLFTCLLKAKNQTDM